MKRRGTLQLLTHKHLPLLLALLAIVLALPSLWIGLLIDDYFHRMVLQGDPYFAEYHSSPFAMFDFANGDPERTRELMDVGVFPWWTLETIRLKFLRPVAVFTHLLDYLLWPDHFPLMHLQNLLWFALLIIVVTLLYRSILGIGWIAGMAALLYAIDDAHAMPAAWVANRNGLLAALFGILTILMHHQWRRHRKTLAALIAPVCLLLSVLSNEGGIAACAYLIAYAVFLESGPWSKRILSVIPYGAVIVGWRLVYTSMGYGVCGSASYLDPFHSPLLFVEALGVRGPVLLLGQWFLPPSDIFTFIPPLARLLHWLASLAFLVVLVLIFLPLLRQNHSARFWALGMMLALIPACATFPADRLLVFVGVGAMGLLAQFLHALRTGTIPLSSSPIWRRLARVLFVTFIVIHLILAPLLLPLRIFSFTALGRQIDTAVESAPLDEKVVDRTVILVNSPNLFLPAYLQVMRYFKGEPVPARIRSLGPNMGVPLEPLRVTRTDPSTLVVEAQSGFQWFLVRDKKHPLTAGEEVKLSGMTAKILTLTKNNVPQKVSYRFDVPLEDPSLVWLEYKPNQLIPFTPPAVDETTVLNE